MKTYPANPLATRMNRALKMYDEEKFCKALAAAINSQNKFQFAAAAGINRTTLYRAFERGSHPNFSTVLRVLKTLSLRLMVLPIDPSDQRASSFAARLTAAFETEELQTIRSALAESVHDQKNIVQFARQLSLTRTSLYRWLKTGHSLSLRSVFSVAVALEVQLSVKNIKQLMHSEAPSEDG